ncbi:hypothetical protein HJC23_013035, partial [Cyclotella cryptica]
MSTSSGIIKVQICTQERSTQMDQFPFKNQFGCQKYFLSFKISLHFREAPGVLGTSESKLPSPQY